jgi:hypothetical protein
MRKTIPASIFAQGHPDYTVIAKLEAEILFYSNGQKSLDEFFPAMMRDEIDKLIDTPNTDRRAYADLEKVEKTYIGTRVEIRLRKFWGFPKGRLDLQIGHTDVDIKHTMESGWMIPAEAVGAPCVLTAADETTSLCYMGLIVAKPEYLTMSANRDQKVQIATPAWKNIRWLVFEYPYPKNFWQTLPLATVGAIFEGKSGQDRVVRLFREVQDKPISRKVVIDVAQQLDPIKRIRKNGGARDALLRERIVLLSGNRDKALILALGLPLCARGEFIAHELTGPDEYALAENHGALK